MLAVVDFVVEGGVQKWFVRDCAVPGKDNSRTLCECKTEEDADMIAAALNLVRAYRHAVSSMGKASKAPKHPPED